MYQARLRVRVEEPDDLRVCFADLAVTMLGIDHCVPLRAVFIDSAQMLVGRADLSEYLEYRNTQGDARGPQLPESLMFGAHMELRDESTVGWSKGLKFFRHPEIYVDQENLPPITVAPILYNLGCYIAAGARCEAGETMSTAGVRCAFESGTWDGEEARRVVVT